jgi:predicted ribosome quality control (RQC) complex YloA/Tae2 family protein
MIMTTIPKMRTLLLREFPEPQADLLAQVFIESYDELVTKAELNELTGVVNKLAQSVQELSEAQKQTERSIAELSEDQKRTERNLAELSEAQKQTDRSLAELSEAQKRTEWAMADLTKQVGGLANALGGSIEDFACELVPELLEKNWEMQIDSARPEEMTVGNRQREIDVVVRGSIAGHPVVVLCEAKASISPTEVQRFLKTVEKVRSAQPAADIRPLFFGYKANRTARDLIIKSGAAMVFTRGVMIPEQDKAA